MARYSLPRLKPRPPSRRYRPGLLCLEFIEKVIIFILISQSKVIEVC